MPAIRAEHGKTKYGVYDLVYDTEDEFLGTPHSKVMPGSTAFIIEDSKKFMLNNKGEWVEIFICDGSKSGGGSGGSSGGSTEDDDYDEVIYNGGDLDKGEDWGLNK